MAHDEASLSSESSPKRSFWRSIFKRLGRTPAAAPACRVEGLESREMFSGTGPALMNVELTGPTTAVTSVILTFNESLNPTTAQNTAAYAFGKPPVANSSSDSGLSITDFLPFRRMGHEIMPDVAKPKLVVSGKIQFGSAIYDDTNHTVTLTALAPFKASTYFRFLRIKGIGPNAILDTTGNALNGGLDTVSRWTQHQGKTVSYFDGNKNHVTLKLKGRGKLVVYLRSSLKLDPVIFVEGATASTIITGAITKFHVVNPTIAIGEINGMTGINNNLLNNPSFVVLSTVS